MSPSISNVILGPLYQGLSLYLCCLCVSRCTLLLCLAELLGSCFGAPVAVGIAMPCAVLLSGQFSFILCVGMPWVPLPSFLLLAVQSRLLSGSASLFGPSPFLGWVFLPLETFLFSFLSFGSLSFPLLYGTLLCPFDQRCKINQSLFMAGKQNSRKSRPRRARRFNNPSLLSLGLTSKLLQV